MARMAGGEMIRIEALTVAMSMPSVVFVRTDHSYGIRRPGLVSGGAATVCDMTPQAVELRAGQPRLTANEVAVLDEAAAWVRGER